METWGPRLICNILGNKVKPFNLGCKVKRAEVVLENVGDMPPNFFKKPKCGYESETMEKK